MQCSVVTRCCFCVCAAINLTACGTGAELAIPVDAVRVQLEARNATWQAAYVIASETGKTLEIPTGREVHVPLGAEVRLVLSSREYITDFTIATLGLREFAAPSLPSELHFHADRIGRYDVRSDEFCGLPHQDALVRGTLVVEDPTAFVAWIHQRRRG